MTPKQFLKIRERIWDWGTISALVLAISTFIALATPHFFHLDHGAVNLSMLWVMLRGLFADLVVSIVAVLAIRLCRRWFVRRHPEMENIDEWERKGFRLDDYPYDQPSVARVIRSVIKTLADLGILSEAAFEARDVIRKLRDHHEEGSARWDAYNLCYQRLCSAATEFNEKYFRYWNFLVDRMDLPGKMGIPGMKDARAFRERAWR